MMISSIAKRTVTSNAILVFLACFLVVGTATESDYKNVYGKPLKLCSEQGMALTGFTRNGKCVEQHDDQGSHHICIDLSSTSGGNFCQVTGQGTWCDESMPCFEAPKKMCPVKQWCVCQWAFAEYMEKAGGCGKIQDIVCDAVNMEAYKAYEKIADYKEAYDCLKSRCKLGFATVL